MATRLLSFLSDIEQCVRAESAANGGPAWEISRIVNYNHGLARMTLTAPTGTEGVAQRGTIFLQSFLLADNTLCLKASLNWQGSEVFPVIPVYSKPKLDWKIKAARIASAWLAGPPNATIAATPIETDSAEQRDFEPLIAVAG
jgi:hypothetical protein